MSPDVAALTFLLLDRFAVTWQLMRRHNTRTGPGRHHLRRSSIQLRAHWSPR